MKRHSPRRFLRGLAGAGRLGLALVLCLGIGASYASAQQPLPVHLTEVTIGAAPPSEVTYRIDLDTLPPRPRLIVEATPNFSFEDIQLEVRLENWVGASSGGGPGCHEPTDVLVETEPSGPVTLIDSLYTCDPDPDVFNSGEVDVVVRVVSFGAAGTPAKVDISIYAITQVPTKTLLFQVESDLSPQTVSFEPSKDTAIFEREPTDSSGSGLLWSGTSVELIGGMPFSFWSRTGVRSLVAFDFVEDLPFNAQVTSADLRVYSPFVIDSGTFVVSKPIALFKMAPSPDGLSWAEGNAMPQLSEMAGASSSLTAANWNARRSSSGVWATPGGDVEGTALDSINVTASSTFHTFSSAALEDAVQSMIDAQNDEDGFMMTDAGGLTNLFSDRGVSFYPRETTFPNLRPRLTIDYAPTGSWSQGDIDSGVVSFTDEGDNFRWIYDEDEDDILITAIGGVCEVAEQQPGQQNYLPYTYGYDGPAYTGVDCCTWQVDSDASGTVGAGQALFFHNVDASDPANFPPDTDGDGIVDLCDNCPAMPNGPAMGVCVGPGGVGAMCQSDLGCSAGEICELSQQDADLDGYGNPCAVPEPGFGAGMFAGMLILAGLRGRDRVRPECSGVHRKRGLLPLL